MKKVINLNDSIYKIYNENPDIIEVLYELGFNDITKPGMINTAGRFMTLIKGSAMRNIDLEIIKNTLYEPYGIELIGSKEYDEEDDDWACEEDFVPKKRECPNFEVNEDFEWEYVLEIVTKILKELVTEHKDVEVLNVEHITTGFCDGDLVVIK